jgi:hypothetical protein
MVLRNGKDSMDPDKDLENFQAWPEVESTPRKK